MRMPETFQDDQARSSEDADEAFARLLQTMEDVNHQLAHIETTLQSALNSFHWACAWGPIHSD